MIITVKIEGPGAFKHMTSHQMGAFVAHCHKQPHFDSIKVGKGYAEVSFNLLTEVIHFANLQEQLQKEMEALAQLDPFPCVCGCGAYITISPCYRQSGEAMIGKLTQEEFETAKTQVIAAIKMVRARTGLGLKDAKDLVDQSGAYKPWNPLQPFTNPPTF